jgi:hypothetical protein
LKKWDKKIERLGEKATDNQTKKSLSALARYNYVSELLGDNSPAKEEKRAAGIKAAAEAALQALTENIS